LDPEAADKPCLHKTKEELADAVFHFSPGAIEVVSAILLGQLLYSLFVAVWGRRQANRSTDAGTATAVD
jgi:hypothetical protein